MLQDSPIFCNTNYALIMLIYCNIIDKRCSPSLKPLSETNGGFAEGSYNVVYRMLQIQHNFTANVRDVNRIDEYIDKLTERTLCKLIHSSSLQNYATWGLVGD